MTEGKGVALAILGVVAVIAVVGLILLFTGATGKVAYSTAGAKLYGGGELAHGLDQYRDPQGFVRDSTNRIYEGPLYGYMYGDDFRGRIKDSGNGVPYATYDQDYKRTGPILNNPCPFPPYTDPTTMLYAEGRECVPQGFNPVTEEMQDLGVTNKNQQVCCI